MKKLLFVLLLVLIAGTVVASPRQQGVALDDLTTLAQYAPDTAPFFAAIRTDEGYVDALDNLLTTVNSNLPEDMQLPPFSLRDLISMTIAPLSYDELRAVLGDTVGVYVTSVDAIVFGMTENPLVVAAEITSQEAAVAFFDQVLAGGSFTKTELDNGAVYYAPEFNLETGYLITDDAVLIGTFSPDMSEAVLPGSDLISLAQLQVFADTMNALPRDDYNITVYLDLRDAIVTLGPFVGMAVDGMEDVDFQMIAETVGQQALGFVILDGQSLVIDYARVGPTFLESDPLDLTLLERVPDTTSLLIHSRELGSKLIALLDVLPLLDEAIMMTDPNADDVTNLGDTLYTFLTLSFEGTFGMPIEQAAVAINGDVINYLAVDYADGMLTLDNTTIFSNEAPDVAAQLITVLAEMVTESFVPATFDNDVLNVPLSALFSLPDALVASVGSNDEVIALGSEQGVAFALEPSGDTLTDMPGYAVESALFLPDAETLLYVDVAPLRQTIVQFVDDNAAMFSPSDLADIDGLMALLNLIETASITVTHGDDVTNARFTLTVAN
ncbi:MAG: hypothetical protein CUN56_01765 [Phototrophicales bacterium]|nr:MAG: hypothetical protein CUN56_01765 [Phototrophicales bacterium]RMG69937.1 MAG: hypothetical protein D6711_18530 [Chloroflexota bacterium]